jgi:hypothetical protein
MTAFEQKRRGIYVKYDFGDTTFAYTIRDKSGEAERTFKYEWIDAKNPYAFRPPSRTPASIIAVLWIAGAVLVFAAALAENATARIVAGIPGVVLIAIVAALKLWRGKGAKRTLFNTTVGQDKMVRVIVLEGEHHDAIVGEIKSRWRDRMRARLATVDLANDANKEAEKFRWLRDNEVIDEREYKVAMRRIVTAQTAAASSPSEAGLLN